MELTPKIKNIIESPLFRRLNLVVEGTIKQINDPILVITKEGKSLTIIVNEEIHITMVEIPKLFHKQPPSLSYVDRKKIDLKTLKIGDYVSVFTQIKSDGMLMGRSMTLIIFLE